MFSLIIALVLVGVALYLINVYVPMAYPIKMILNVVVVVVLILWLIRLFGVADIPIRPR